MTENECCKNTDNRIESVHDYKKIKMQPNVPETTTRLTSQQVPVTITGCTRPQVPVVIIIKIDITYRVYHY